MQNSEEMSPSRKDILIRLLYTLLYLLVFEIIKLIGMIQRKAIILKQKSITPLTIRKHNLLIFRDCFVCTVVENEISVLFMLEPPSIIVHSLQSCIVFNRFFILTLECLLINYFLFYFK